MAPSKGTEQDHETLTAAQHTSRIRAAHNRSTKGQYEAGLAVVAAESAGMLTFSRATKDAPLPEGVVTRGGLAKVLGCSPTLVSKYRGIGRLAGHGIIPGHADYTFAAGAAATAWVTEALDTGDTAKVVQAIADHRPGSQSESGGKAGKNVKKGTKKPQPASTKDAPATVTRTTVEADVTRVVAWLTANGGKRLDAMTPESLDTIHALLMSAGEAVEAAQVRKGQRTAAPVEAAA